LPLNSTRIVFTAGQQPLQQNTLPSTSIMLAEASQQVSAGADGLRQLDDGVCWIVPNDGLCLNDFFTLSATTVGVYQ
jgi:hypothetical protein